MDKKQNPPVKVSLETKKRLDTVDFLEKDMTYNGIIRRLLDFYDSKNKVKK